MDGIKDHMCVSPSENHGDMVWLALSSEGCPEYFDFSKLRTYEDCPGARTCKRPDNGCKESGQTYMTLDCDGDGILDHFCTDRRYPDVFGHLVLSTEGCPSTWNWNKNRKQAECNAACNASLGWDGNTNDLGAQIGVRQFFGYCGKNVDNDCDGSGNPPKIQGYCKRVDRQTGVRDIEECGQICKTKAGCNFYSYTLAKNDGDCLMYDACPQMRPSQHFYQTRMACANCHTLIIEKVTPIPDKDGGFPISDEQEKFDSNTEVNADLCASSDSELEWKIEKGHTITVTHTDTWSYEEDTMHKWHAEVEASMEVKTAVTIGGKLFGEAKAEVTGKVSAGGGLEFDYDWDKHWGTIDTTSTSDATQLSLTTKGKPWQWIRYRLSYRQAQVKIPVTYDMVCKETGEQQQVKGHIETTALSNAEIREENMTEECPQYNGKCRCTAKLSSEFQTGEVCSNTNINYPDWGCYVAKNMDCQNVHPLNNANPNDHNAIGKDRSAYWDFPLPNAYFMWSSDPCQPDCPSGQFATKYNGRWKLEMVDGKKTETLLNPNSWECSPWKTCPSGQTVVKEGTAHHDRVCSGDKPRLLQSGGPSFPSQNNSSSIALPTDCKDLGRKDCKAHDSCLLTETKECVDFECGLLSPTKCKREVERCTFFKENSQCLDHFCAGQKMRHCKKDALCAWFGSTCVDFACSVFNRGRCGKEPKCQWVKKAKACQEIVPTHSSLPAPALDLGPAPALDLGR